MQAGLHVVPLARVEVHPEPGAPFVMAPDASHEMTLHTAVSVRVPAVHDLDPDRV